VDLEVMGRVWGVRRIKERIGRWMMGRVAVLGVRNMET
jgi:hypothetical protein